MGPWVPTAITVGLALLSALEPTINSYVAAHPQQAVLLAGVWAILKGLMKSPVGK